MKQNPELKCRLLDAAERLYARTGEITVRPVAREASTTTQTLYTYFPEAVDGRKGRELMVAAMVDRALTAVLDPETGWVAEQATRLRTLPDGAEALPGLVSSFLALLGAHPVLRRFLTDQRAPDGCDNTPVLEAVRKVTAVFDRGLELDARPDGDVAARVFLAQVIGIAAAIDAGFIPIAGMDDETPIVDLLLGGEVLA